MSQPPYPPPGGEPPGDEHPTERFAAPPPGSGEGQRHQTRQFGQPPYGQQPYGPPPYGPPPYGPPPYGPPPYGPPGQPPPYAQPYGQPPYGPPPYGQPWSQPPYGQPPHGRPAGRNGMVIALVVAGVVVLAAVGVGLWLILGNGNDPGSVAGGATAGPSSTESASEDATTSSPSSPSSSGSPVEPTGTEVPAATVPPDELGDDVVFDQLALECYDGDMTSCDALFEATKDDPSYTEYTEYADTCAGRQESGTSVYCRDAFPGG